MTSESNDREELVSREQSADQLSVRTSTLYRMIDRGEVKGRKVGRQWRFRINDLKAYLERGPQAVALSTVSAEEIDAFLVDEANVLKGLGVSVPPLPRHAEIDEKLDTAVERLFHLGIAAVASDIHLVPERESVLVQVRIDGVLSDQLYIPQTLSAALVGRLKQISGVNPDERSIPQDGRIHFRDDGRDYDLRINFMPTTFGESIVMRILDQGSVLIGMERLGLSADDLARLRRWNSSPTGLIISAGPTGSGKTTTLYSCLW